MSQSTPEAVTGYLAAADAGDFVSAAAWFTPLEDGLISTLTIGQ